MHHLCMKCHRITDDPMLVKDCETGYRAFCCPHCGCHDSLIPISLCKTCGVPFETEFYYLQICPSCRQELSTRFEHLLEENFTSMERQQLNEIYDGIEF